MYCSDEVEGSESDSEPEPSSLEKGDAAMEWIISPTSLQARQEDITKKIYSIFQNSKRSNL